MINLFSFCDCHWLIPWLLPFLLGLLLGWLLWARFRRMYEEMVDANAKLKTTISGLEKDLAECKAARSELTGQVATANGRVREMEASVNEMKTSLAEAAVTPQPIVPVAAVAATAITPDPTPPPAPPAPPEITPKAAPVKSSAYGKLKSDNLQIIEGVGPKMESVLHDNGVNNWSALGAMSPDAVKGVLQKYGDKYRIIDPATWPAQAQLAADENWEGLIDLQKNLDTGRASKGSGTTDSKLEKIMIKLGLKRKYAQDDLKAIEGIGPKIAGLLNDAGINTWRGLADSSVDRVKEILAAAGPRYKLADPGSWPKQAGLAADGKFDELQELQDFLQGGK